MKRFNRRKICASEYDEQKMLCDWLDASKILYYAIPNGGKRNIIEAARLKRTGVKSGVPDICIPISNGQFHSLYLELKRQKHSSISENQIKWIEDLKKYNHWAVIVYGCDEAIEIVKNYLRI